MNRRDRELLEYYEAKFAVSSQSSWNKTLGKYGTESFFNKPDNHTVEEPQEETSEDERSGASFRRREEESLEDYLTRQEDEKDATPASAIPVGMMSTAKSEETRDRSLGESALRIGEISAGMERMSIIGRVEKIGEKKLVNTRFGEAYVANAILKDESGSVSLDLWRDQISKVRVGDRIRVRNGVSRLYGNEVHVFVPSTGSIELVP